MVAFLAFFSTYSNGIRTLTIALGSEQGPEFTLTLLIKLSSLAKDPSVETGFLHNISKND